MTHEDRQILEALFDEVADLPEAQREARLAEAGRQHPEVAAEVRRLLYLDRGSGTTDALFAGVRAAAERATVRFDRYVLVGPLGEGATGVVYAAEQCEPVRRLVAIKVLKPGMDSATILRRIEFERRALSMLDHPNVAALLDAGATPDGRPYFVMPLVHGLPITDFCDHEGLAIGARITVFTQACLGVRHAHQHGIIHRDLKPANILAAGTRQGPLVRVIDFGIAKALAEPAPGETAVTELGLGVGTRGYMSPEQAAGDARSVDVRTDIYGLGAVLYELISGKPPIDPETLRGLQGPALAKAVAEGTISPPTPFSRATDATRDPLPRSLATDLGRIALRCLAVNPHDRYADVGELLDDLDRWTRGDPVRAGPRSTLYRARKLARKHRALVGGVAVGLAAILGGAALAGWFAIREKREAAYRQTVLEVIESITGNQSLVRESVDLWGELPTDKPLARALTAYAGGVYMLERHRPEEALPSLRESLELAREYADALPALAARVHIARALLAMGRLDEAESELRAVPDLSNDNSDRAARVRLAALVTHSWLAAKRGNESDALEQAEALEPQLRAALGPAHAETVRNTIFRARLLSQLGRHTEATELASWLPPILEQTKGVSPSLVLEARLADAERLLGAGRPGEALDRLAPRLREFQSALGPDNVLTLSCRVALGRAEAALGRTDPALEHLMLALEGHERAFGAAHSRTEEVMWETRNLFREGRRLGDLEGFLSDWQNRRELAGVPQPDVPLYLALRDACLASGRWDLAREWGAAVHGGTSKPQMSRAYLHKP